MRRVWVWVLVGAFSFSLIAPALIAAAGKDLPECCRRDGRHHCGMMATADAQPPASGKAIAAAVTRCPFFPKGGALLPQHGAACLPASVLARVYLGSASPIKLRIVASYRTAARVAHQERGPPSASC